MNQNPINVEQKKNLAGKNDIMNMSKIDREPIKKQKKSSVYYT